MAGFIGSYSGTLDAKNRLHLPTRLRQGADQSLDTSYLTLGVGGPLFLFPKNEWRRVEARLENLSFGNPESNFVVRMLMANTFEVSPDRQNRILLPPELSAKVGIEKDVKVIGVIRRVEIWSAEKFQQYEAGLETRYDKAAAELFQ